MAGKKRSKLAKLGITLLMILPTVARLICRMTDLVEHESHQALRYFVFVIVLCILLGSLLASLLISILIMLFYTLLLYQMTWVFAAMMTLMLNIIFLLIVCLLLVKFKNRLLFPETCRMLRAFMNLKNGS